jgi:hypothetical protein
MKCLGSPQGYILLAVLVGSALFVQCRGGGEESEKVKSEKELIEERLGKTLGLAETPDSVKVAHLVRQWNGCHNLKYVDNLYGLYDSRVFFYGVDRSRAECLGIKRKMLQKYPDYFQRIIGGISVRKQPDGTFKCTFTKYLTVGQVTAPVPSYLIMKKNTEDRFVIIAESDPETDNRAQIMKDSVEFIQQLFTASNTEIKGNFSGGGQAETLYVFPPDDPACSDCVTSLFFSNEQLPPLEIKNANGVNVLNEGDLDGDGADEFSVLTLGRTGDSRMIVYTFKRGQWVQLTRFNVNKSRLLNDEYARKDAVRLAGQGYIYINEWASDTIREQKVNIWDY